VRLVQVTIPAGKVEAVLGVLDDGEFDYVVTDETSGREYTSIAYVLLPSNALESVLEKLRDAGIDDQAHTVVIEANTVVSRDFEEVQEQYAGENTSGQRIAREELQAEAEDLVPAQTTYVIMTVVSAVIATAGLLLDSPAVVVGSMVIAPLIGPAMATSVGTVIDDAALFDRGVTQQLLGLVVSILSAAFFAFLVKALGLIPPGIDVTQIPEVRERLAPDFLSLVVAIGAGVAGVISLSTGVSAALVGVMIAVALIPPAATVGIGIAFNRPMVSLGSGILLMVNVLSINLAALVVLWYTGYRPQQWFRLDTAKSALVKRATVLVIAIAVLSVFLGGVTYDTYENARSEELIREDVESILATEQYESLSLLSVEVSHTDTVIFRDPREVVVTVGVPPGHQISGLASRIDAEVVPQSGEDIHVEVHYVTAERVD
jgi:uncharacterized hydrophobic protein (TIGR00341 family)